MAQLPPAPHPIGVFGQFITQHTETLILKEKVMSLSGDSFDIKLANGTPIFKIKGRHMTISGRKSVYDMQDNHLFDICKEMLHLHSTYIAEKPDGQKFFECKSSFKLIGSKATASFTSQTGKHEELVMSGNFLDSRAEIVDKSTGQAVAFIDRKLITGKDVFFEKQTYALVVAPGVDMALMVAMCVAMDEKNNDKDR